MAAIEQRHEHAERFRFKGVLNGKFLLNKIRTDTVLREKMT